MENLQEFNNNVAKVATEKAEASVNAAKLEINENIQTVKDAMTEAQKAHDDLASKVESIYISTQKAERLTLKEEMAQKENIEGLRALKNRELHAFEVKLNPEGQTFKALSYGGSGDSQHVPMEARDLEIQTNPHYQTSVAGNIRNATTSGVDVVRYIRENSQTNSAAGKAHGAAFAEKTVDLRNYSENIVTLGEFITLDEEQLSDVAGLRSFITQEFMGDLMDLIDRYILDGTGGDNNQLNGFSQTGQNTAWADQRASGDAAIGGANNIDVLINAISQLESSNYKADTIFLNPADFWSANLALAKSSQNEYVARQILQAASTGVMPMIAGAKIVRSNAVTSDKYFVLDSSKAAKLWTGEGTSLEFARNGDDFKNNQISGRIKCRKALTVGRPSGIIYGDFSTDRATLAAAAA